MTRILSLLTDIEIEIEKIEPSRRDALLDLLDKFRADLLEILGDTIEDETEQDDHRAPQEDLEKHESDNRDNHFAPGDGYQNG